MIFVFGSNLVGRHGKGAALEARELYGAIYGQATGLQGRSYAIPTKDENLSTLRMDEIEKHFREFVRFAEFNDDLSFALVPIGCGLAGYKRSEMLRMIQKVGIPPNVFLTHHWVQKEVRHG